MPVPAFPDSSETRPKVPVAVALYVFWLATVGRTLAGLAAAPRPLPKAYWLLGLELAVGLLFSLALWWPSRLRWRMYAYLAVQAVLIVTLQVVGPGQDFLIAFFVLLTYQAATFLHGWNRWAWITGFALLSAGTMSVLFGPLKGLSLSLVTIAAQYVMAAFIIATREVEAARARSQAIVLDLQDTQQKLEEYASQVGELAALEERNRLARDLHDSVSQTIFSIQLDARSAQLLLDQDPAQVRAVLIRLQGQAQSALAEMRGLITQLRYQND